MRARTLFCLLACVGVLLGSPTVVDAQCTEPMPEGDFGLPIEAVESALVAFDVGLEEEDQDHIDDLACDIRAALNSADFLLALDTLDLLWGASESLFATRAASIANTQSVSRALAAHADLVSTAAVAGRGYRAVGVMGRFGEHSHIDAEMMALHLAFGFDPTDSGSYGVSSDDTWDNQARLAFPGAPPVPTLSDEQRPGDGFTPFVAVVGPSGALSGPTLAPYLSVESRVASSGEVIVSHFVHDLGRGDGRGITVALANGVDMDADAVEDRTYHAVGIRMGLRLDEEEWGVEFATEDFGFDLDDLGGVTEIMGVRNSLWVDQSSSTITNCGVSCDAAWLGADSYAMEAVERVGTMEFSDGTDTFRAEASATGSLIAMERSVDEPELLDRGVAIAVRHHAWDDVSDLEGEYRIQGLQFAAREVGPSGPIALASRNRSLLASFDGAGGFSFLTIEEDGVEVYLDTLEMVDPEDAAEPGPTLVTGTYSFGLDGELLLTPSSGPSYVGQLDESAEFLVLAGQTANSRELLQGVLTAPPVNVAGEYCLTDGHGRHRISVLVEQQGVQLDLTFDGELANGNMADGNLSGGVVTTSRSPFSVPGTSASWTMDFRRPGFIFAHVDVFAGEYLVAKDDYVMTEGACRAFQDSSWCVQISDPATWDMVSSSGSHIPVTLDVEKWNVEMTGSGTSLAIEAEDFLTSTPTFSGVTTLTHTGALMVATDSSTGAELSLTWAGDSRAEGTYTIDSQEFHAVGVRAPEGGGCDERNIVYLGKLGFYASGAEIDPLTGLVHVTTSDDDLGSGRESFYVVVDPETLLPVPGRTLRLGEWMGRGRPAFGSSGWTYFVVENPGSSSTDLELRGYHTSGAHWSQSLGECPNEYCQIGEMTPVYWPGNGSFSDGVVYVGGYGDIRAFNAVSGAQVGIIEGVSSISTPAVDSDGNSYFNAFSGGTNGAMLWRAPPGLQGTPEASAWIDGRPTAGPAVHEQLGVVVVGIGPSLYTFDVSDLTSPSCTAYSGPSSETFRSLPVLLEGVGGDVRVFAGSKNNDGPSRIVSFDLATCVPFAYPDESSSFADLYSSPVVIGTELFITSERASGRSNLHRLDLTAEEETEGLSFPSDFSYNALLHDSVNNRLIVNTNRDVSGFPGLLMSVSDTW